MFHTPGNPAVLYQPLTLHSVYRCSHYIMYTQVDNFRHLLLLPRLVRATFFTEIHMAHQSIVFCVIFAAWVYFVPETKGRRIKEMDEIFDGNQAVEDMARIADIRRRLGIIVFSSEISIDKGSSDLEAKEFNIEATHREA